MSRFVPGFASQVEGETVSGNTSAIHYFSKDREQAFSRLVKWVE
jgi:hypothetical protein